MTYNKEYKHESEWEYPFVIRFNTRVSDLIMKEVLFLDEAKRWRISRKNNVDGLGTKRREKRSFILKR